MTEKTQLAHNVVSITGIISGLSTFFGLLPHLIFLTILLTKGRTLSLDFLILTYVGAMLLGEYIFWNMWKKRISAELKTTSWKVTATNHKNIWIMLFNIIADVLTEIFLMVTILHMGCSPVWAFFVLISSKAFGAPVQLTICDFYNRKKILMLSNFVLVFTILALNQLDLTITMGLVLISVKGLLGNVTGIARAIIADHREITLV